MWLTFSTFVPPYRNRYFSLYAMSLVSLIVLNPSKFNQKRFVQRLTFTYNLNKNAFLRNYMTKMRPGGMPRTGNSSGIQKRSGA